MKILHVVPTYLPAVRYGGPIYSVHGLCRSLAEAGHEIHVFTTNVDGPSASPVPLERPVDRDGVKVWYFPSSFLRRLYYSPSMGRALRERTGSFEIVHNHSVFLWPTWEAARQCRRKKIPYAVSPRGMLVRELIRKKNPALKNGWIFLAEKNNLENASVIHLTSEEEKKEILKFGFKLRRLAVVPNGVDIPAEKSAAKDGLSPNVKRVLEAGTPYILFLGRINWKKGLDRLVEAMKRIPGDARLVIAGNDEEGYAKKIEKLAAGFGVAARINFTGPVYGADKQALYENAECFVLPSVSENFGNSVIEAMASGCPAVVTPGVGLSGLVRSSGGGLVADGDPDSLGRAITGLLADPAARERMSSDARKASLSFSWGRAAAEMSAVYGEVLADAR